MISSGRADGMNYTRLETVPRYSRDDGMANECERLRTARRLRRGKKANNIKVTHIPTENAEQ